MKRFTIIFLLLAASFTITFAQSDNTESTSFFSGWQWGAKAGINLSNMYGDVGNNSYLIFIHLGAVANKSLNDKLGLAFEPHISIEGQNLNGGFDRITFLNIPALATYKVTDNLSVDGGLKLGVKITEKTKFGTSGNTERRNRFKTFHPGIVVGSTFTINEDWFAQFRTNIKLPDVVRKSGGDSEGSIILLFQFSAGYMFGG